MELIGPYLCGCLLLVGAGVAKLARPDDTARALAGLAPGRRTLALSTGRHLVRMGAGAEALLGLAALAAPRPITAGLVAASYLAFAAVVAVARRRGSPLASCGCFGRPDTPATAVHVGLNVLLGAAAVAVAVHPPASGRLSGVLSGHVAWDVALLALVGVGTYLSWLAYGPLSSLAAARQLVEAPARGRSR